MKRALVLAGDEKLVHYEASLPIYMENFSKYCLKDVEPYDGIRELLASLKEMGVHVAVLSNKPHDQAILNAGMETVGVLWGFRDREELEGCHPQYIVAHPSEVAEIVKKKNESHGRRE